MDRIYKNKLKKKTRLCYIICYSSVTIFFVNMFFILTNEGIKNNSLLAIGLIVFPMFFFLFFLMMGNDYQRKLWNIGAEIKHQRNRFKLKLLWDEVKGDCDFEKIKILYNSIPEWDHNRKALANGIATTTIFFMFKESANEHEIARERIENICNINI